MPFNEQFARTVRIAIPLQSPQPKIATPHAAKPAPRTPKPRWTIEPGGPEHDQVYQELLQSLYDGVLITEISGKIIDCNDRAMEFLQYGKQELSDLNITEVIIGADRELLETLCHNIDEKRFTLIEAYCRKKDGSTAPAEIAANRLVLTRTGHLCFFMRDITRRKEHEEQLEQTVDKLKELNTAKARFVSNASHELRTPLTIISTYASMMFDGVTGELSNQQQECLSTILRNCERLSSLIDDVLDLGRMESGREEFRRRRAALDKLLQQCRHDFLPQFEAAGKTLELELPDELPAVLCDHDKTAQVLTNLVGNALKFTDSGGKVILRAQAGTGGVRVEVEDNGAGISREDHSLIFEPFSRVEHPEGAKNKGTGLGLAISKHIVEIQGGKIGLRSEPDAGACFHFTVPLYNEPEAFDAFLRDRLVMTDIRGQRMGMLVIRLNGNNPGIPETAEILRKAFDCPADHLFVMDSQPVIVLLKNKSELSAEQITRTLSDIITKQLPADTRLEFACLIPSLEEPPAVWLKRALQELTPASAQRKRILIVDDEEAVLKLMTRLLHNAFPTTEITATTSGYDACIQFGKIKPDLVVLDLHLADINGRRVFESMARAKQTGQTRTLVVSGFPGDIDEMMNQGCDDYLCKPFDFDEFVNKTQALIWPEKQS